MLKWLWGLGLVLLIAGALPSSVAAQSDPTGSVVTSPMTVGDVGSHTSMVLDFASRPVIAYHDAESGPGQGRLVRCDFGPCTTATTLRTFGVGFGAGQYNDVVINSSSHPRVSYYASALGLVALLFCLDPECNSSGDAIITENGAPMQTAMALDSSGFPIVAYGVNGILNTRSLVVTHCGDQFCGSGNVTNTVAPFVGEHMSMVLDASGNPVISFAASDGLGVAHCNDPACASATVTSPDTSASVGGYSSIALKNSGLPVVTYHDASNRNLKLLVCINASCTSSTNFAIDTDFSVGRHGSLALDSSDAPVVSYVDSSTNTLRILRCGEQSCSSTARVTVNPDPLSGVGNFSSLALTNNDYPKVAYYDDGGNDLRVLTCSNVFCGPSCDDSFVTINMLTNGGSGIGTAGDDVILGTDSADFINGNEGDDTICGQAAGDTIRGGPGDDTVYGEDGEDEILGGGGADILDGGQGADTLRGQGGPDTILGGTGPDVIDGQGAADILFGGSGADVIRGQNGGDTIDGGQTGDELKGQTGPDIIFGGTADDTIIGGNGADVLYGGPGFDKCAGNFGPDQAEAATCEQTPGVEILF